MPAPYIQAPSALGELGNQLFGFGKFLYDEKKAQGVELARQREEQARIGNQANEFFVAHGGGQGDRPNVTETLAAGAPPPPPPEPGSNVFAGAAPSGIGIRGQGDGGGVGIRAGKTVGMGIAVPPIPKALIDAPTITGPLTSTHPDDRYQPDEFQTGTGAPIKGFTRTADSLDADKELAKKNEEWQKHTQTEQGVAALRPDLGPDARAGLTSALDSGAVPSIPALPAAKERRTQITEANGRRILADMDSGETIKDLGAAKTGDGTEKGLPTQAQALRQLQQTYGKADYNAQGVQTGFHYTRGLSPSAANRVATMMAQGSDMEEAVRSVAKQPDPRAMAGYSAQQVNDVTGGPAPLPSLPTPDAGVPSRPAQLDSAGTSSLPVPNPRTPVNKAAPAASAPAAPKAPITSSEAQQLKQRGWSPEQIAAKYTIL